MERGLSKASLALANPMEHLKGLDNATKNLVLREGTMFAFITGLFKIKGTVLPVSFLSFMKSSRPLTCNRKKSLVSLAGSHHSSPVEYCCNSR
jgi:hypothetical protein